MYFTGIYSKRVEYFQGLLTSSEEKQKGLQTEARQLKSSLKKHENLVEKYKKKVQSVSVSLQTGARAGGSVIHQAFILKKSELIVLVILKANISDKILASF